MWGRSQLGMFGVGGVGHKGGVRCCGGRGPFCGTGCLKWWGAGYNPDDDDTEERMNLYEKFYGAEAAARFQGEDFLPLDDGEGNITWVIPDAAHIPDDFFDDNAYNVCGGVLQVGDTRYCDHLCCSDDGWASAHAATGCPLPQANDICVWSDGRNQGPDEYERECWRCTEDRWP